MDVITEDAVLLGALQAYSRRLESLQACHTCLHLFFCPVRWLILRAEPGNALPCSFLHRGASILRKRCKLNVSSYHLIILRLYAMLAYPSFATASKCSDTGREIKDRK